MEIGMPDNLQRRRPEDPNTISLGEAWEVKYWCEALGVTEARLREAVRAVGHSVAKVRAYLKK